MFRCRVSSAAFVSASTVISSLCPARHDGFSADKTLSVAQSLYEKKVLSYPRTGSRYLSDDVFDEIPDRIALLERYPALAAHAAALKGASLNRRSVDAGKVTDHHMTPTLSTTSRTV